MKHGLLGVHFSKLFMNNLARKARKAAPERPLKGNFYGVKYGAHKKQKYDVYFPEPSKRIGRLILDIHGGAFVAGDCIDNWPFARFWLEKGYDFIAIDYRLTNGKVRLIDQVADCASALSHIAKNLSVYGFASDSVFLTGDSAGGLFAGLMALLVSDPLVGKEMGIQTPNLFVKGAMLNCPVYDLPAMAEHSPFTERAKRYALGRDYKETSELCTIRHYVKVGKMPWFVSTCTNDFLREEARSLAATRKASRLKTEFLDLECADPKVGHVHNVIEPFTKESLRVNEAMHRFIEKIEEGKK